MFRLLLFLFIAAAFISSCSHPTGIKELVSGADSVAVSFFKGDGSMDTVYKVRILRNKKELDALAGYIESSSTENNKCGYDGTLHFFRDNVVLQEVDFRMNDAACMHFFFTLKGRSYNTRLPDAAKQFLRSVNKN